MVGIVRNLIISCVPFYINIMWFGIGGSGRSKCDELRHNMQLWYETFLWNQQNIFLIDKYYIQLQVRMEYV